MSGPYAHAITVLWLMFAVYWIASASATKSTKYREAMAYAPGRLSRPQRLGEQLRGKAVPNAGPRGPGP